jgi:moderate conductance mechanosensitive channel
VLPAVFAPLVSAHTQVTHSLLNSSLLNSPLLSATTPSPAPSSGSTPEPSPSGGLTDLPGALRGAFEAAKPEPAKACQPTDMSVCGLVVKFTDNQGLGQVLDVVLGTPLRLLLIVTFAVLIRRALHRVIDRLSERIAAGPPTGSRPPVTGLGAAGPGTGAGAAAGVGAAGVGTAGAGTGGAGEAGRTAGGGGAVGTSPVLITRRQARSRTLAAVLRSITTIAILAIAILMVLQELDFSVTPLLSLAGVFGVALGFGAQSLVRDVVSGMFMIVEDQYGVGDVVDVGAASGSVESVGLRITRLRDVNGTVWYVRNGEILRVGNQSQGWARAVLDVNVGYTEDIDRVEEVLLETAQRLRTDEKFAAFVIDEPEVWGVEALTTDSVVMRLVVKTVPLQQWLVARELRRRIKQRFDAEGIDMRTMPRTVIVNGADEEPPRPTAAEAEANPLGH